MADTKTESPAEEQVLLMRADITRGLDDVIEALQSVTRGGGRLAESGGNLIERELNMVIGLSEEVRDSLISAQALKEARAQPLNGRLRKDGHRVVDLLVDIGGVTVHGAIRAADTFFAQRPPVSEGSGGGGTTPAPSS